MSKFEDEAMDLIETVAENSHHNAAKPFGRGATPKGGLIDAKSVEMGMLLEKIDKKAEVQNLLLDRFHIHNRSEGLAPVALQEASPCAHCSRLDHVEMDCPIMEIQGQGMYRQGPPGGQSQQGRPNYQGTYPTYFNNHVYHNPMQQQQQGFRRNTDQMYPPYSTGQQQNSQQQPYANAGQSMYIPPQQSYNQAPQPTAPSADPILGAISQLMEQMSRMNSRVDEIQDFVKTNIPTLTDNKRGKQVFFSDQLPSQATIDPRNQGSSSSQTHNLSHVHVDEEAVEAALAISSLRSAKDLPDPYKDHPLHKISIDDETSTVVVEPDSSSDDEEERVRAEPNPDTYKPPVPYPQALSKPKAKVSESDDHLLEAFQKVTITIPLVDAIRHIPSYAKFLKGICTPHRSPKRIQLSENISSIMMNSLPIKKRDPGSPMITSEIGGMTFTRSLLDTGASINILPKAVYDRHHVGELQPFLIELWLADGSVRKPHGIVEDVIVRIKGCYFPVDFLVVDMKITKELSQAPIILGRPFLATAKAVTDWGKGEVILKVGEHTVKVNINKLMKYPSQAFEDVGAIDLFDDQDIETCIKEVMTVNEGADFEELPLDELTRELKPLPSTLKYAFLDS